MIVVDASALLEVLLVRPAARNVESWLSQPGQTVHAPYLIDVEVTHVIRRFAMRGQIDDQRGQSVLADYTSMTIQRYPHEAFLFRVWELRNDLSAYDSMYVALAETLDAPLITCDGRLAKATGHSARIEVI
jgi:predicted nucleic acid-binding protein